VILRRNHWIFDLDGTLTVAVHDFDAIRAALGLPAGVPILEAIERLPGEAARAAYERLDGIELELARRARPAAGSAELLGALRARGARIGILTRNSLANVVETLRAAGLAGQFAVDAIVAREQAAPKPSPAGVLHLLERWCAPAQDALVVGDSIYDLLAGRAAGAATVYVDESGEFPHAAHADLAVRGLDALRDRLERPAAWDVR
jgi:HAD superfamily hydrolase (TIGR01509 family)